MATYTHRKGVGEASWYIGDDLQKHRRPIEIMRRCFVKKDTMAENFNAGIENFRDFPMFVCGEAMYANVWRTSPTIRRLCNDV